MHPFEYTTATNNNLACLFITDEGGTAFRSEHFTGYYFYNMQRAFSTLKILGNGNQALMDGQINDFIKENIEILAPKHEQVIVIINKHGSAPTADNVKPIVQKLPHTQFFKKIVYLFGTCLAEICMMYLFQQLRAV